jgi:predicted phage-related endonuclease
LPPAATGRGAEAILGLEHSGSMIEWDYPNDEKEEHMAGTKAIRKKIGNIEGDLKKRVVSLEKDLTSLFKKLVKKEKEVKKLKEKMTSQLVKSVKKKVKKARKKVAKRLSNIL